MAKSLQDQLLSLGLANKKQGNAPDKQRKQTGKSQHTASKKTKRDVGTSISLEQAYRLKASEEKSENERNRQRKRAEDKRRRQINKQLRQLIDAHALNDEKAEIKRNFLYKGRIRRVLVTREQLTAVNTGEIGIVYLSGRYFLLSGENTEAARTISADHVPDLGGEEPEDAEFPVPDDLIW